MAMRDQTAVFVSAILCATLAGCRAEPGADAAAGSRLSTVNRARVALTHALPQLDGSRLKATVVEVTYGPGESSPPHSHPCPVIGYVVEGALRTQVKGESLVVYRPGESFYEAPHSVHLVSANASQKEPTRFIASFTCDRDTPLSVGVPETGAAGGTER